MVKILKCMETNLWLDWQICSNYICAFCNIKLFFTWKSTISCLDEISELSALKKRLQLSEALLLAPKSDLVIRKQNFWLKMHFLNSLLTQKSSFSYTAYTVTLTNNVLGHLQLLAYWCFYLDVYSALKLHWSFYKCFVVGFILVSTLARRGRGHLRIWRRQFLRLSSCALLIPCTTIVDVMDVNNIKHNEIEGFMKIASKSVAAHY